MLQIQDELSRYLRLIPCVKADMQTATDIVFEEWVCLFGFPKTIKSDHQNYDSTFYQFSVHDPRIPERYIGLFHIYYKLSNINLTQVMYGRANRHVSFLPHRLKIGNLKKMVKIGQLKIANCTYNWKPEVYLDILV